MKISKQLINVLGAVVIVGILVAGALLGAFPLYGQAQRTDADTRTVAQTNGIYDIQVVQLTEASRRIAEIETDVAGLRREVAAIPQLDDVFEIVTVVASESGATIESISAVEPEAFAPRTAAVEEGAAAASETAAQPAPEPTAAAEDKTTATDATQNGEAPGDPAASAEEPPQRQIPITITVEVADATQAAAFMDALGRGPRLLSLIDGTFSDGTLTVSALAFTRTED
ncbi:hypothetical protein K0817_011425 [Microbacterium sp. HD4P20]|uniref:hypothetical protein n=1 Tax=Microbacterium sp. HD4P20 TaxID=2864874 RepID=UPI001C63D8D5|nr:hypothetical protein [Microbacterium sp. HD4P20]MCP2637169.1 hypothetical protein [Microbacterium sp. HD4P20]